MMEGLGLLDVVTSFAQSKVTMQVSGVHPRSGHPIEGYEVHMGRTVVGEQVSRLFAVQGRDGANSRAEGAVSADGRVMGTYIHGAFDGPLFRRWFLNAVRATRGWEALDSLPEPSLDQHLDQLADFVALHVDMRRVAAIAMRDLPL
jgi:adenosylcobyric acid synthase